MRGADGRFVKGEHWRPHRPHWDAEWLRSAYCEQGRSTGDIARDAGVTDAAIIYWLRRHGIERRTISQARAVKRWGARGHDNAMFGRTGDKNPRFVDGSSPERQRMYVQGAGREFLRSALARDCYRCVRCGVDKSGPKSLHVHHVRPWSGNPDLRFNLGNVVTLCRGCHGWVHSRANTDREYLDV